MEGHGGDATAACLSPDGARLASGGADSSIRVWDLKTRKEILKLQAPGPVKSIAFSPDGTKLATGLENGTALIWSLEPR